jgi:hypothetical protein
VFHFNPVTLETLNPHRITKPGAKSLTVSINLLITLRNIAQDLGSHKPCFCWICRRLMTLMGRQTPGVASGGSVFRSGDGSAKSLSKKKRLCPPDFLNKAVTSVATIGGYLNRSGDPPPGHQIMWQGYSRLQILCEGFLLRDTG